MLKKKNVTNLNERKKGFVQMMTVIVRVKSPSNNNSTDALHLDI